MNLKDPAIIRQQNFKPPYCPNQLCDGHLRGGGTFHSKGWVRLKNWPYYSRRFLCVQCKRSCSYFSFKLDYRDSHKGMYSQIFALLNMNQPNCAIAKALGVSETCITKKLRKMSEWALLEFASRTKNLEISEDIVLDGLENFALSQFEPNQIIHSVGSESLFIYDFSFSPMNRKGRRSERQRLIEKHIDQKQGRFPKTGVRTASGWQIDRLMMSKADPSKPLIIRSDGDRRYSDHLKENYSKSEFVHHVTPSTDHRDIKNKLFSVNHTDNLIRHHSAAFKRETIAFSKKHSTMVHKYILFMIWKNFFRTQFVKKHKKRPRAHLDSPAMALGLEKELLKFHNFFSIRPRAGLNNLSKEWKSFYTQNLLIKRSLSNSA